MYKKSNKINSDKARADSSSSNATKVFFGICALLLIGLVVLMFSLAGNSRSVDSVEGVSSIAEDGKQVINLTAKGGYTPGVITAQAGKESVLKVRTSNTFDCSSALTIPSLKVSKNLPPTGDTLINLPVQSAGTELQGTCSMGMYSFTIKFV